MIVCVAGCSSSTKITALWKSPKNLDSPPRNVLVAALTARTSARQQVETDLVNLLQENGVEATSSIELLPPNLQSADKPDPSALLKKVTEKNVDAIITIALVDKQKETRYVGGASGYAPITSFGYYGRFSGYYTAWFPMMVSPGYYQEDKRYFIETNLYDAKSERLLWSAQSETYNPTNLKTFSENFAQVIINKMKADRLINETKI
jgi:hypothetical protein